MGGSLGKYGLLVVQPYSTVLKRIATAGATTT
eukprot:COSAG01_NODE_55796_length_322_cov_2.304933_1_plen_31_part_10